MTDAPPRTDTVLVLEPGVICTQFANVALFAGKDHTRPVLECVLFEIGEEEVRIVATDSYMLGFDVLDGDVGGPRGASFLVPAVDVASWAKLAAKQKNGPVTITFADGTAVYADDRSKQSVRLGEGAYPNYRGLVPTGDPDEGTKRFSLRADLLARLAKVRNHNDPKNAEVPITWNLYGELKVCLGKIGPSLTFVHMGCKIQ